MVISDVLGWLVASYGLRIRSEGFPFLGWGSGGWTVFASFAAARHGRVASTRVDPTRGVPLGSALVWAPLCRVDPRLGPVACVALCHGQVA